MPRRHERIINESFTVSESKTFTFIKEKKKELRQFLFRSGMHIHLNKLYDKHPEQSGQAPDTFLSLIASSGRRDRARAALFTEKEVSQLRRHRTAFSQPIMRDRFFK